MHTHVCVCLCVYVAPLIYTCAHVLYPYVCIYVYLNSYILYIHVYLIHHHFIMLCFSLYSHFMLSVLAVLAVSWLSFSSCHTTAHKYSIGFASCLTPFLLFFCYPLSSLITPFILPLLKTAFDVASLSSFSSTGCWAPRSLRISLSLCCVNLFDLSPAHIWLAYDTSFPTLCPMIVLYTLSIYTFMFFV